MAQFVKSVQPWLVTMGAASTASTTNLATAVNTANSVLFLNGVYNDIGSAIQWARTFPLAQLTSSAEVTVTRSTTANNITVAGSVIEFAAGVVASIQTGTINLVTTTSAQTALGTPVSTRAFVLFQGCKTANGGTQFGQLLPALTLPSSTAVEAKIGSTVNSVTVGYAVVDLTSDIIATAQQRTLSIATTTTSDTDNTFVPVNVNNAAVMDGGHTGATATNTANNGFVTNLTSASISFTRNSSVATNARVHYYTIVEFQPAALTGSVQRGTVTLSASSAASSTIAQVSTNLALLNTPWFGMSGVDGNAQVTCPYYTLASTAVSANMNAAGSVVGGFEVIPFSSGTVSGGAAYYVRSRGMTGGFSNMTGGFDA